MIKNRSKKSEKENAHERNPSILFPNPPLVERYLKRARPIANGMNVP